MENRKKYHLFSCQMRIDEALSEAIHLPLDSCSRYIIISDCHRGEGGAKLWENRHLSRIEESHRDVYCWFETLQKRCRLYRIYGNHNMEMKGRLGEAIILDNCEGGRDICMIHGHQADFFNSVCWKLSLYVAREVLMGPVSIT